MTGVKQLLFVVGLGGFDCLVKQGIDFSGKLIGQRVKLLREVLHEVECMQLLAHCAQFLAYASHSLHVYLNLDTELSGKHVNELKRGSGRTAAKPPYIRVKDVDAVNHGHQR